MSTTAGPEPSDTADLRQRKLEVANAVTSQPSVVFPPAPVAAAAEEDADDIKARKDQNYRIPLICFFLSFILPPIGWVGFMISRDSPRETPRGAWAFRSCAVGSLMSFLYTLLAACLVGHYGQLSDTSATAWGCGFGGKCPLFKVRAHICFSHMHICVTGCLTKTIQIISPNHQAGVPLLPVILSRPVYNQGPK
eukprot:Blabericola_migrator_1__1660@NODE_1445_length_4532_cov_230_960806_g958_i0_p4_GENE_NODE_1445_length_4532_cov_230_960806_g958_i0NODE_1445_length_4532_cov_230_960806_g958_i0_p4_ORF_typecomplete_len194_score6_33DUF3169/PF11368_8/0_18_NODE_1445_length_4532_cov_230_960806_g958_i017582339